MINSKNKLIKESILTYAQWMKKLLGEKVVCETDNGPHKEIITSVSILYCDKEPDVYVNGMYNIKNLGLNWEIEEK